MLPMYRRVARESPAVGAVEVFSTPDAISHWVDRLTENGGEFGGIAGPAILAFPLLVLGLSGFETGVSMMPLVKADNAEAKVRNTGKLLATAASVPPPWPD